MKNEEGDYLLTALTDWSSCVWRRVSRCNRIPDFSAGGSAVCFFHANQIYEPCIIRSMRWVQGLQQTLSYDLLWSTVIRSRKKKKLTNDGTFSRVFRRSDDIAREHSSCALISKMVTARIQERYSIEGAKWGNCLPSAHRDEKKKIRMCRSSRVTWPFF